MHKLVGSLLLALWVAGILVALFSYGGSHVKAFDPDMKLAERAKSLTFDESFVSVLNQKGIKAGAIVHVSAQTECYCETLSKPHSEDLYQRLEDKGFTQYSLALTNEIAQWIPSAPAVAVIDENNSLRYLGPYAIGLGCFTGKDIIAFINDVTRTTDYFGAQIQSDVSGCFC